MFFVRRLRFLLHFTIIKSIPRGLFHMRLSADQIAAIKQETEHCFGTQAEVRLFGSRAEAQRGFTLTELVTVIILVGILAVAALPRFMGQSEFEERGTADQVRSALRYAQKVAVAQHTPVSITLAQAADPACTTTLTLGALSCSVSNKVTLTGAGTYTFDALGRPSPNVQSVISVGGTAVTIEQETGYVH